MSSQVSVESDQGKPLMPQQPEVNIGTSGHVDHGKCVRFSNYALVDGMPMTGQEIQQLAQTKGRLIAEIDGGSVFSFQENSVVSIDGSFKPIISRALFYSERYQGPMVEILTRSGRAVSVTPAHPLLVNRRGSIIWLPAGKLEEGDDVAILRTVPLPEDALFAEPLERLGDKYNVVTWQQYQELARLTNDFSKLNDISVSQMNQVRILLGLSIKAFCKTVRMSPTTYRGISKGEAKRSKLQSALVNALSRNEITRLSEGEFVVEKRTGGMKIRRLKTIDMDENFVKWLAFVWSEGFVDANSVGVTRTRPMEMVREWTEISRRVLGTEVNADPAGHYTIYNTPLVDYLRLKFGFGPRTGAEHSIAPWVCKLPVSMKATFLRWFLTLDGEFDEHSGRIVLYHEDERSIIMILYILHSFGIVPRLGKKTQRLKKSEKAHHKISISGRGDLAIFAREIGFEDPRIQDKLRRYLRKPKKESEETDFSIPIDFESIRDHLRMSGLLREGFGDNVLPPVKSSSWYKVYETARNSRRLSRTKLLLLVREVDNQINRLEQSLSTLRLSSANILAHMSLAGMSQETLASELGYSRRELIRAIRKGTDLELEKLALLVELKTRQSIKSIDSWLVQLRMLAATPLEFDRIVEIKRETYDGMVFDLSVPGPRNFIGGTSSIVCHNTTLTQAITGIWASAHSEELKRGITIKVGYADAAFYRCTQDHGVASYSTSPICPVCGRKTDFLRAISFVDCPGHESLMTNMLAGAFLMDGALLVIAANEPVPKPQTREHLQALQMLGMKKIVIAQNKVDLVTDAEAEKNYSQIQKFAKGTVAEGAPIIPISAQQRLNIDALIEALEEVVPTPKRDAWASPLMYVLRSFDVNKPGADVQGLSGGVLGGSLTRGELKVGDEVELKPGMVDERSGKFVPVITRVASLQTSAGLAERVGPGGLIAVGTHLDPTFVKGDQMVGSVIGKPGTLPETLEHVTLDVTLLETAVGAAEQVKVEKIKLSETVRLNLGTASTLAVATSVRGEVVELDLKKPVAIERGMRAAVSRRIAERWRLIGSGVLK